MGDRQSPDLWVYGFIKKNVSFASLLKIHRYVYRKAYLKNLFNDSLILCEFHVMYSNFTHVPASPHLTLSPTPAAMVSVTPHSIIFLVTDDKLHQGIVTQSLMFNTRILDPLSVFHLWAWSSSTHYYCSMQVPCAWLIHPFLSSNLPAAPEASILS